MCVPLPCCCLKNNSGCSKNQHKPTTRLRATASVSLPIHYLPALLPPDLNIPSCSSSPIAAPIAAAACPGARRAPSASPARRTASPPVAEPSRRPLAPPARATAAAIPATGAWRRTPLSNRLRTPLYFVEVQPHMHMAPAADVCVKAAMQHSHGTVPICRTSSLHSLIDRRRQPLLTTRVQAPKRFWVRSQVSRECMQ